jgi:Domain of unknown function (DUF4189)
MIRSLALVFLLVCAPRALAEGNICPDGYYPIGGGNAGWEGCAAYEVAPGQPQPDPGPLWVSRWGAIAVDGAAGKFGGEDGLQSKRKAEKAAIRECQKYGGKNRCFLSQSMWRDGVGGQYVQQRKRPQS